VLSRRAPGQPLEVEIGCGNGHFLEQYCSLHPQVLYLGVELKHERCLKACRKIERRALEHAHVVEGEAEEVIRRLPAGVVDTFHLYFPDPWPKSRHRRRRFLRMGNLEAMVRALALGGRVLFTTDFFDYYLQAKVLFGLHPDLAPGADTVPEGAFVSVFGRRFRDLGKRVRTATARRLAGGEAPGPGAGPFGSADDQVPDDQQKEEIHRQGAEHETG
jgi:tRNA G46 methylase TrmB